MSTKRLVLPGDIIGQNEETLKAGDGTHVFKNLIISTRSGRLNNKNENDKVIANVINHFESPLVPLVESLVTAKVTSINTRICRCSIIAVDCKPLQGTFRAILRKEDIRATQRDKVVIGQSYRPGDIIQARVTNLGDGQSYVLSTAGTDLGVVFGLSEAGFPLVPMSWTEMICPRTLKTYPRKVAKVSPDFIASIFS